MWNRISLRSKTYTILAALVFITLLGGLVMVWYTYRIEGIMNSIINRDLAAFQTAESLEIALVNQKGFVSYYFLDGNPDWLRKLGEYRQLFKERLEEARTQIENQQQEQALYQIDLEWTEPLPLHRSGQYN
ncbi:MAG: hypothetical protein AUJ48_03055 [Deltaproteobacteria bacterium CG1_02_45_11]|nr:MAG: hypothetical protein AUJ48_03055 [Deltaproteobacteria bacterium CG1_02_45_11]